jgi:cell division inhibitor SepF
MLDKIRNLIGIEESDYEYVEYPEEGETNGYGNPYPVNNGEAIEPENQNYREERPRLIKKQVETAMASKSNNVIGMPGLANGISEVIVIEPHSFEEMPQVIQALRERKSVVLNLNVMNPEEAQRAVDFVAGGTYAMDGHQERVGESIFLFTPSSVKVSTLSGIIHDVQEPQEIRSRQHQSGSDPWHESVAMAQ